MLSENSLKRDIRHFWTKQKSTEGVLDFRSEREQFTAS